MKKKTTLFTNLILVCTLMYANVNALELPEGDTIVNGNNHLVNYHLDDYDANMVIKLTASVDVYPTNGGVALGKDTIKAWGDMSMILQFGSDGYLKVRNGGLYTAVHKVPYEAKTDYNFIVSCNIDSNTYSVKVVEDGTNDTILLGYDYGFRKANDTINTIATIYGTWQMPDTTYGVNVKNVSVETGEIPTFVDVLEENNYRTANIPMDEQTEEFGAKFALIPGNAPLNAGFAMSSGTATGWGDLSNIIVFNSVEQIVVRNGDAYEALVEVEYDANATYEFLMSVDVPEQTYSVGLITEEDTLVLGYNYGFRKAATELNNLVVRTGLAEDVGGYEAALHLSSFEITDPIALDTTGQGQNQGGEEPGSNWTEETWMSVTIPDSAQAQMKNIDVYELPDGTEMNINGAALEDVWGMVDENTFDYFTLGTADEFPASDQSGSFKLLYDDEGLYVFVSKTDDVLLSAPDEGSFPSYDNVEIYFNIGETFRREATSLSDATWGEGSYQIRFNYGHDALLSGRSPSEWNPPYYANDIAYAFLQTGAGYDLEIMIPWDMLGILPEDLNEVVRKMGFEMTTADADDAEIERESILAWNNNTGEDVAWKNANVLGQITLLHSTPTSVEHAAFNNTIKVYPNPAMNELRVDGKDIVSATIYDLTGKAVKNVSRNFDLVNISSLESGLYFITVLDKNNQSYVQRFIKK